MMNDGGFLGTVVASYPEQNAVDVLLKDGSRLFAVQVQANFAGSGTGVVDLPDVGLPLDETRWRLDAPAEHYIRACVDIYDGQPVVSGFLLPQVTQMTFKGKNRRIMRHASDVYSTIDGDGNIEVAHPAGFFIRIGTSPAHEDLTGLDVDKKWKIAKNTDKALFLRVEMPGGAARLTISPSGDTLYETDGNLTATVAGNVVVNAANATINADTVTSNAATTHCTGDLAVDGDITSAGGVTATGDVTGGGVSLMNHTHKDVTAGIDHSGPPD